MIEVKFHENIDDCLLKYAVIIAKHNNQWVFCKHRRRETFEIPGGHREKRETIEETAKRELQEETGALHFTLKQICVYSVTNKDETSSKIIDTSYGMLYIAEIFSFEDIHSEIEKIIFTHHLIQQWTYPLIQPLLILEAQKRGYC